MTSALVWLTKRKGKKGMRYVCLPSAEVAQVEAFGQGRVFSPYLLQERTCERRF